MLQIRGLVQHQLLNFISSNLNVIRWKKLLNKSMIPEINENDLTEHFTKGSGPGGSKINKAVSCVCLLHKPTGILIKCQEDRNRDINRKIARERLRMKLDNLYNGEDSIENQKKKFEEIRKKDRERKRRKLLELKNQSKLLSINK